MREVQDCCICKGEWWVVLLNLMLNSLTSKPLFLSVSDQFSQSQVCLGCSTFMLGRIFGVQTNGFGRHSPSPVGNSYLLWRTHLQAFLESKTVQVEGDVKSSSVLLIMYLRLEAQGVKSNVFSSKTLLRFTVVSHCCFMLSVDVYQVPHDVGSCYARCGKYKKYKMSNTWSQLFSRPQSKEQAV